jgi:ubiquinone/menaquinone biosynthesis C-methylase UbiE
MTVSVAGGELPSAAEVAGWPYVKLLAVMRESNLPPGGLDTVRRFAADLHLRPGINALHAGCNSGFLSRELARRTGLSVLGIDISPDMAASANSRAQQEGVGELARYEARDMRDTGLPDESFDVVFSGGALAFVIDQPRAVREWLRLVRPHGLIADAELWYAEEPPQSLLDRVAEVIEVPVPRYSRDYWRELFSSPRLLPYFSHDAPAGARDDHEVRGYCETMVDHVAADWTDGAREVLFDRLLDIFTVFNENMKYLSYTCFAYRVQPVAAEPLLFK